MRKRNQQCVALQTAAPDMGQQMGYILEEVYKWAWRWNFESWREVHGLATSVGPKTKGKNHRILELLLSF